MKFKCQKQILVNEISNANDFTSQRNTITMLASIYLNLSDNILTIKATDQKMGFVSSLEVDGFSDGVVAVICDKFFDIIKNLPEGIINIEEKDEMLFITNEQQNIEFKLKTINASDFPSIVIPEEETFFKVSQKNITEMIKQVGFAVSDDESKYAMTGALLEKEDNCLIMVGTDGRRLSYIKREIETEIPDFEKITIPSRFLDIIKKHSLNEGMFALSITNQSLYIKTENKIIFSSLIKNEFPAYKRVIPQSQTNYCIVNISLLDNAIKRAALLVENKYKKIILEFNNNRIKISTEETEVGKGTEEFECQYEGEPFKCALNYMYLQNPLKVMDGTQVRIAFTESGKPFTVTSEPEKDYKHIIMPMNLKDVN